MSILNAKRESAQELDLQNKELAQKWENGNEATQEELLRFDNNEAELEKLKKEIATLERVEKTKATDPVKRTVVSGNSGRISRQDCNNALKALLARNSDRLKSEWQDSAEKIGFNFHRSDLAIKLLSNSESQEFKRAQSVGTAGAGGYSVSGEVVSGFEKAFAEVWDWQSMCFIRRTPNANDVRVLLGDHTSREAAYVGELAAVSNTNFALDKAVLKNYKIGDANYLVSNELLEDAEENIAGYIGEILGASMAKKMAKEITVGDGQAGHVRGFTLDSVSAGNSVYTDALVYADFNELYYKMRGYRRNKSVWMMHSNILSLVSSLVDSTGRPLLRENMNVGGQFTILGRPVITNDYLNDEIGAGGVACYFVDPSAIQVRIVRDLQLTTSKEAESAWKYDATAFAAWLRFDSLLVNPGDDPCLHLVFNSVSGAPSIND